MSCRLLRSRFPPISHHTTPTPLTGIRLNPCATSLCGGPSGHLADPIPNRPFGLGRGNGASDMQFMWPITTGSCPTPKFIWNKGLRDLIQEAETWVMAPKLASLWWTSTYDPEENSDLSSDTRSGRHRFPFEEKFMILGCTMNLQGKAHEGIEERMQSAKKSFVDDVKIHRSKDVPWRVGCRRMVEHVHSVFRFGSEKLVLDPENSRQDQRMGHNSDDSSTTL